MIIPEQSLLVYFSTLRMIVACVWIGRLRLYHCKYHHHHYINLYSLNVPGTCSVSPKLCHVNWFMSTAVGSINLCPSLQKSLQTLHVTLTTCLVHWRYAIIISAEILHKTIRGAVGTTGKRDQKDINLKALLSSCVSMWSCKYFVTNVFIYMKSSSKW